MFFKIPPHFQHCRLCCIYFATIHFLSPKLGSLSNMEYYFYQLAYWDAKVSKHFIGLNQMQCSPSFDLTGANKMTPLATPTISGFTARKILQLPTRLHGRVTEPPNCVGGKGTAPPSNPY